MAKAIKYKALWTLGLSVVAMGLSGVALADSSHSSDQIQISTHNAVIQSTTGQTEVSIDGKQVGATTDSSTTNAQTSVGEQTQDQLHVGATTTTGDQVGTESETKKNDTAAGVVDQGNSGGSVVQSQTQLAASIAETVSSKPRAAIISGTSHSLYAGLVASQNQPLNGTPMTPPTQTPAPAHSSQPLPFDLPSLPGNILQHISSLLSVNLLSRTQHLLSSNPVAPGGFGNIVRLVAIAVLVTVAGSLFVARLRVSGYARAARGVPTGFEFATLPSVSLVCVPVGASTSSLFGGIGFRLPAKTDYWAISPVVSGVRNKEVQNPIRKGVTEK